MVGSVTALLQYPTLVPTSLAVIFHTVINTTTRIAGCSRELKDHDNRGEGSMAAGAGSRT